MSSSYKAGVDIVHISRFKKKNLDEVKTFAKRVLSSKELKIFNSKADEIKHRYLAKRFSAKEAIYKACNEQFPQIVDFRLISILNNKKALYINSAFSCYIFC